MREDPRPGADVTLAGNASGRRPTGRLDDVCAVDGIEAVETANTRRFAGDAGEGIGKI